MIHAHAEAEKNIRTAAEEIPKQIPAKKMKDLVLQNSSKSFLIASECKNN